MTDDVRFTSVEFHSFKAFSQFSVQLRAMNILVGPNNCGKSTLVGAFRALSAGLRRASAKKPDVVIPGDAARYGYTLSEETIPISVENVHTDYSEEDTHVLFRLSNGNRLKLLFPRDGGVVLVPECDAWQITSPSRFRSSFPVSVAVVPVLGPVEHNEDLVQDETVRRELETHRASRHFRSYWHYYPEGFSAFADLVKQSWPGMEVLPPERSDYLSKKVSMFCLENRITRELYWAGFGFQIWCQLLTHISRSKEATILVVDEPEIYLHPDVQRQLLGILRDAGPDVMIATHSTEMIAEGDPSEILLVDKTARSAKRLTDLEEVQGALTLIGSIQNIVLTRLARNRRVVFVEDDADYTIIRRFAKVMGYSDLASGDGLTPIRSEGFGSWERVGSVAWGLERTLGTRLQIAVVYDRDYFCDEQIEDVASKLRENVPLVHIHERKEIENYLLCPGAVARAILYMVRDRCSRTGEALQSVRPVEDLLDEASAEFKSKVVAQYAARRAEYIRSTGADQATVIQGVSERVDAIWGSLDERMKIVPGKEVLRNLRDIVSNEYRVNLSDIRLVESHNRASIPDDMKRIVTELDAFRLTGS